MMREDARLLVRAELCERLERLARLQGGREFDSGVAGMRQLAAAYDFHSVVRLAEALERDSRRGGASGCSRALYLDRMQDAIGCQRSDDAAGQAMIASVSVRFA